MLAVSSPNDSSTYHTHVACMLTHCTAHAGRIAQPDGASHQLSIRLPLPCLSSIQSVEHQELHSSSAPCHRTQCGSPHQRCRVNFTQTSIIISRARSLTLLHRRLGRPRIWYCNQNLALAGELMTLTSSNRWQTRHSSKMPQELDSCPRACVIHLVSGSQKQQQRLMCKAPVPAARRCQKSSSLH